MNGDHQLDLERRSRLGMVEAIWGEHKSADQIARIIDAHQRSGELILATRIDADKARAVLTLLRVGSMRAASVRYDPEARCLVSAALPDPDRSLGTVAILGGGSSDLTVAAEARLSLLSHRVQAELVLDVGVAGLQRLLGRLTQLRSARVLIACAGMEGSLPTILAGLLPQPVIGVPVSVGYGVSAGGQAALMGMLASCAPGLSVVNIDNGYGAAMAALRILNSGAAGAL